jgi:hypothetical protein
MDRLIPVIGGSGIPASVGATLLRGSPRCGTTWMAGCGFRAAWRHIDCVTLVRNDSSSCGQTCLSMNARSRVVAPHRLAEDQRMSRSGQSSRVCTIRLTLTRWLQRAGIRGIGGWRAAR